MTYQCLLPDDPSRADSNSNGHPQAEPTSDSAACSNHQLSRMCRRGLVQRHSGDGRAIHAAITAAGGAALEAAVPRHTEQVRRLVLDRLTPQQIDQLADISRRILDGLDRS